MGSLLPHGAGALNPMVGPVAAGGFIAAGYTDRTTPSIRLESKV